MFARVTTVATPPDRLEESIRMTREVAPRARQIPGSKGFYSLVDRASSKGLVVTLWESEQALNASRAEANRIRAETVAKIGGLVLSVEEYEVIVQP